jgi:peptidoglycan/xylan/chitin deacetylase (PgdA/CDA1 family)
VIARLFLPRAVAAAVLAAGLAFAASPLAGSVGSIGAARAADPAAIDPAQIDPAAIDPAAIDPAPIDPPPTLIRHGPRTDRVVALTFDDGWSPTTLRQIYRILVRERVPATFFVTGIYVQRAPALWREIAAAGFPLANHSYLHRDARDLSARDEARDLAMTREAVEKATGRAMLPYYRPPYGARNPETDRRAASAGFPYVVLWDTTAADTIRRPTVAGVVRTASAGRSGSIVLLHAGPSVTPRALPAIIARYRARGFRFVTLPELIGLPPDPATPPALVGVPPDPATPPAVTTAAPSVHRSPGPGRPPRAGSRACRGDPGGGPRRPAPRGRRAADARPSRPARRPIAPGTRRSLGASRRDAGGGRRVHGSRPRAPRGGRGPRGADPPTGGRLRGVRAARPAPWCPGAASARPAPGGSRRRAAQPVNPRGWRGRS